MGDILKFLLGLFLVLLILPFIIGLGWLLCQIVALIFGLGCITIAWDSILEVLLVLGLVAFFIWCLAS